MAISLYDLSVVNYLQTLGAMEGFLAKGLSHFQGSNADPNAVLDEKLCGDMLPFKFQVWATTHHSLGAIKGGRRVCSDRRHPFPRPWTMPGCRRP